jgi:hypothetical protein
VRETFYQLLKDHLPKVVIVQARRDSADLLPLTDAEPACANNGDREDDDSDDDDCVDKKRVTPPASGFNWGDRDFDFTNAYLPDVELSYTAFMGPADEGQAELPHTIDFSNATFNGYVNFYGTTFNTNGGDVRFYDATFNTNGSNVRFEGTTFNTNGGWVYFNDATFNTNGGWVNFIYVTFNTSGGWVHFDGTTFNTSGGYANFYGTTFNTAIPDDAAKGGIVVFRSIELENAHLVFSAYSPTDPETRAKDNYLSPWAITPMAFEGDAQLYSYPAHFDRVPSFAGTTFDAGNYGGGDPLMACTISFADVTFGDEPTAKDGLFAAAARQPEDGETYPVATLAAGQSIIIGFGDDNRVCSLTNLTEREIPLTEASVDC